MVLQEMTFSEEIMAWYSKNKRYLPWRTSKDPYKIWLSEIILQQTRVEQGLPYYLNFNGAYPTIFHLANAPIDEVLKLWQGLGYYNRAKNLHTTAKYIAKELKGVFPKTYQELLTLKGIGDYTASAIASICFDEPHPVVDGNVYRALARYFSIEIPINSGEGIKYFKDLALTLLDKKDPATYNQAIMEFGAMQCKPKSPNCSICPVNSSCGALQKNKVAELPVKLRKGKIKMRFFNYIIVTNHKEVMLQQRTKKDIWQNLYEFPLIETVKEAKEEEIISHPFFKKLTGKAFFKPSCHNEKNIIHKLSHQHVYAKFWIVAMEGSLKNGTMISKIKDYPVSVLIANFVEKYFF
jgi:A/G-specific adenine glycosylase